MNKLLALVLKAAVLLAVLWIVGRELYRSWQQVSERHIAVDWRWGLIAVSGFCTSMLTSALVWRWLAWKMGDRSPSVPLLGAYTFSQMGKYIPGKVTLLLMRIERARRFGMSAGVCTLSTLLENVLYAISGGLLGLAAVLRVLEELRRQGIINQRQQQWQWPVISGVILLLAAVCHPLVFYGAVNRVLRKMKKVEVPAERQLKMRALAMAVVGFVPCWMCGGMALWASTMCVYKVDFAGCWWFAGAFALSVIMGMASLVPGGLLVREAVLGAAVAIQLAPVVGHANAVLLGGAAAVLQRLFQLVAEILLGICGGIMTAGNRGMDYGSGAQ